MSHPAEHIKTVADALSFTVVLGTIVETLPAWAALTTIIWTSLRIYEWVQKRRTGEEQ